MKRKFKDLCFVIATAIVMSAIGASTAVAAEFHASSAPTSIAGSQTEAVVFTTNAGTVTCKTFTVSGTQEASTSTFVDVTPHLTNCTAFGFINVQVHVNACSFRWYSSGTSEIRCGGKEIEITAPLCTTKIGPQHFGSGVSYTTSGTSPNRDWIAHVNISGVKYDECGTKYSNGALKGKLTVDSLSGELWFA